MSSFAGVDQTYRHALPSTGRWIPLIDASAAGYGGRGDITDVRAEPKSHRGSPASAEIDLPALTTLWLTGEQA